MFSLQKIDIFHNKINRYINRFYILRIKKRVIFKSGNLFFYFILMILNILNLIIYLLILLRN